jgi:hypothetical protein
MHAALACRAYRHLRSHVNWKSLFDAGAGSMKSFFNQKEQYKLAHFLTVLMRMRKGLLELGDLSRLDTFSSSESEGEDA